MSWRAGAWRVLGERALFEAARPALEAAARGARSERGPRPLGPFSAFFKGSPLRTRPALRHALRRAVGLEIPRLKEFRNLGWLEEHGFVAVHPLLAGVRMVALLPRYQFLFTAYRPAEPTLGEWFPLAPNPQRAARLATLARDVARLHRLGFVHRDLFPRNLLVCSDEAGACAFLDAWRGGEGRARGLRGPNHDLACLLLDGARLFTREEQALFLGTYREESLRLGRTFPSDWPERVERARTALYQRESRRRTGLDPAWRFPELG